MGAAAVEDAAEALFDEVRFAKGDTIFSFGDNGNALRPRGHGIVAAAIIQRSRMGEQVLPVCQIRKPSQAETGKNCRGLDTSCYD